MTTIRGYRTHFSPSISMTELAPPPSHPAIFTAYRCDRDDGYGGFIIIAKKDLII